MKCLLHACVQVKGVGCCEQQRCNDSSIDFIYCHCNPEISD